MDINALVKEALANGLKKEFGIELAPEHIILQETKKEFEGSVTFTTFTFAKQSKKSPEETGNILGNYLQTNLDLIGSYNVVKGFLNLVISDKALLSIFDSISSNESFGIYPSNGQKVIVEYSSPNTNKPLHLGHLRNNFLGYAVSNILQAKGFEVVKINLVNDRGIHICKSMIAYELYGNNETPEEASLKGDHLIGKYYVLFDKKYKEEISSLMENGQSEDDAKKNAPLILKAQEMLVKWEAGDEKVYNLWKKLNNWVYQGFNETYKAIGVTFDKFYYESETYLLGKELVLQGVEENVFFKKEDNSVWVDLTKEGLDQKLLLRGDGTSVYITQDLGTAELKYNQYKADHSIYVVGNEQDYHFKVLKAILNRMGKNYADGIFHLSYGMVDLPSGKMKSREGTVVDADDLIHEMIETAAEHTKELGKIDSFSNEEANDLYRKLGLGALKYFLLKVDPKKRMLFNPKESVEFQGHTGPFIQYTYARISAIVRKADQLDIHYKTDKYNSISNLEATERDVVILLNSYPDTVSAAADGYAPSVIANYSYELAKTYNRFYTEVPIFNVEDKALLSFRIAISWQTALIIKKSMALLGIEVPERM